MCGRFSVFNVDCPTFKPYCTHTFSLITKHQIIDTVYRTGLYCLIVLLLRHTVAQILQDKVSARHGCVEVINLHRQTSQTHCITQWKILSAACPSSSCEYPWKWEHKKHKSVSKSSIMSDQILQVVNQHHTFTDASLKLSVCRLTFCRYFALQLQSECLNLGILLNELLHCLV